MTRKLINYFAASLLILLVNSTLYGIDRYLVGDTLHCIANGGLTIREKASFSGNKIGIVPYGAIVTAKHQKIFRYNEDTIRIASSYIDERGRNYKDVDLQGQWILIIYKNITGYVFDTYLSRYAAPHIWHDRKEHEYFESYIARLFELQSEEREATTEEEQIITRFYSLGITQIRVSSKVAYSKWVIPNMSLEEIVIILKNQASVTKSGKLRLVTAETIRGVTVMEFEENEGFIRVISVNGSIILESEHWC